MDFFEFFSLVFFFTPLSWEAPKNAQKNKGNNEHKNIKTKPTSSFFWSTAANVRRFRYFFFTAPLAPWLLYG
jgi:hypothetical protein